MALFWLINPVTIAGIKKLPGHSMDDANESAADYAAAGALLWPQGNATVDAAAAAATSAHVNKGANEQELFVIMDAAVNAVQKANDLLVTSSADLASTSAGKGASLVGVQDAAGVIAATTTEAALAEIFAKFPGITKIQLVAGTLVTGAATVTVGAGQAVTALTRAFPIPSAVITGSTNFGGLAHIFASNVVGGSGVGQVVINALGSDGAIDADAAGTFAAILVN